MDISPEQLISVIVFSDDAVGFELSYPIYEDVNQETQFTTVCPRIYIRLVTPMKSEIATAATEGPKVGYHGVSRNLAAEIAESPTIKAMEEKPLLFAPTLPRTPMDATGFNNNAPACMAINLTKFAKRGGCRVV